MSSFYMANPQNKDPERAHSLSKYLLLHSQQQNLRRRLSVSSISSSISASIPSHSEASLRVSSRSSSSSSLPNSPTYKYSAPCAPVEELLPSPGEERAEDDLYGVNHQIKTTLTELLNCESVKQSKNFRMWVQSRLMDAELELKRHRRSRSASLSSSDPGDYDTDH